MHWLSNSFVAVSQLLGLRLVGRE